MSIWWKHCALWNHWKQWERSKNPLWSSLQDRTWKSAPLLSSLAHWTSKFHLLSNIKTTGNVLSCSSPWTSHKRKCEKQGHSQQDCSQFSRNGSQPGQRSWLLRLSQLLPQRNCRPCSRNTAATSSFRSLLWVMSSLVIFEKEAEALSPPAQGRQTRRGFLS